MPKAAFTLLGTVFLTVFLTLISGCNYPPLKQGTTEQKTEVPVVEPSLQAAIESPAAPRLLTICLGREPVSLFLYGDSSQAARAVRQAIYDGPFDIRNYEPVPVILEKIPRQADGDIAFEPVSVQPGGLIANSDGLITKLEAGTSYLPSGCTDPSCAAVYNEEGAIQVDQQVVKFRLRTGLNWSDGSPITADDSQYSFEVAKSLYPRARAELILHTHSYQAVDELTIEWRGAPGYRYSGYVAAFFPPLPRKAWSAIPASDLLVAEQSTRQPIGWGPYVIDEWTVGDHISLSRNPNYFRINEGLPHFDKLVFRFPASPQDAYAALLAGECDYLDETIDLSSVEPQIVEALAAGKLKTTRQASAAWEHLDFGIISLDSALPNIFQRKEARQAVAMCVDRSKIITELFPGLALQTDSYIAPDHPLFSADLKKYAYDPDAAGALLDSIGWKDQDGNAATPRQSMGVSNLADGIPFEVDLLVGDDPEKTRMSELLRASLAECGIGLSVKNLPAEELFSAGPAGEIFGRKFSLAQFGWMGGWQPPCFLFTSQEIPGAYPQFPKGWGGSNVSGYSNPDFDRACARSQATLPEDPGYQAAHISAQSIFVEDLPVLPLYLRQKRNAARPDLCGDSLEASSDSALWNLEAFDYGDGCSN